MMAILKSEWEGAAWMAPLTSLKRAFSRACAAINELLQAQSRSLDPRLRRRDQRRMAPGPRHASFETLNALIDHIISPVCHSVKQKDLPKLKSVILIQMLMLENDGRWRLDIRPPVASELAGNAVRSSWLAFSYGLALPAGNGSLLPEQIRVLSYCFVSTCYGQISRRRHAAGAQAAPGDVAARPNLAGGGRRRHPCALTTRTGHGSAKPLALSRVRIRLMPRSWLKTTTKTRRPLKSGTNG